MKTSIPSAEAALIALALATGAGPAAAQEENEFSLSISAGASYSDNINRVAENEESETSADAGLQMNLIRSERRLNANVATDLTYRTYLDNTYDDELLGGLNGSVVYAFVPDRFSWTVEDNFGQSFIDAQAVETPDNRQNTNYLSTGPDVNLPLGGRTLLSIQARWSDVAYETSNFDSQRYTGTLGLIRELGERSSVSLNGSAERIEYDESPPNSDYDSQSVYLGYEAEGARTTLNLRGGYTALHDFGDTSDGPLFGLSLSRQVSPHSTLSLDAGTDYTDSADAFRRDQSIGGVVVGNEDAIASGDPFQSDYATLVWMLDRERSSFSISVDWRQEDHARDQDLNRERFGGDMTVTRKFSQKVSASLNGTYNTEDFSNTGVDFDEWLAGLALNWIIARSFSLSLVVDHSEGSGGTSTGTGVRDFEENRVSVRFAYSPGSTQLQAQ